MSAFLKLRDAEAARRSCWSRPSRAASGATRSSAFGPRKVLRWSLGDPGDPYALAAAELRRTGRPPLPGLPPFAGGAVGMFAYDLVRTVEPLGEPNPDPVGLPDLALMLTDALVVVRPPQAHDHRGRQRLRPTTTTLEAAYAQALRDDRRGPPALAGPLPRLRRPADADRAAPAFQSNMTREQFEANVARIIEYIYAGDAFQVVPSQRWSAPVPVEAFSIYRGLRAVNPSPYMYFLDFGDFEIAGASPEPLITVSGRRVATRPIAGTRPRGATRRGGRAHGRRAAGRREGAGRARDARRPRAQRPRTGLRVRHRRRSRASWRSRTTAT